MSRNLKSVIYKGVTIHFKKYDRGVAALVPSQVPPTITTQITKVEALKVAKRWVDSHPPKRVAPIMYMGCEIRQCGYSKHLYCVYDLKPLCGVSKRDFVAGVDKLLETIEEAKWWVRIYRKKHPRN